MLDCAENVLVIEKLKVSNEGKYVLMEVLITVEEGTFYAV